MLAWRHSRHQMLRALLRFTGLVLLAGGFAALVVDGTRSIAASDLTFTKLGSTFAWLAPALYGRLEPAVDKVSPMLWNPLLTHLLAIPTWVMLSLLGLLVIYLGRPRAPRIGYSSRP